MLVGMAQGGRADLHNDRAERARRARVVRAHVEAHGHICPGFQREAHPATDLTADHAHGVAAGGDPRGPLAVLCRSCNGKKGKYTQNVCIPAIRSRNW